MNIKKHFQLTFSGAVGGGDTGSFLCNPIPFRRKIVVPRRMYVSYNLVKKCLDLDFLSDGPVFFIFNSDIKKNDARRRVSDDSLMTHALTYSKLRPNVTFGICFFVHSIFMAISIKTFHVDWMDWNPKTNLTFEAIVNHGIVDVDSWCYLRYGDGGTSDDISSETNIISKQRIVVVAVFVATVPLP